VDGDGDTALQRACLLNGEQGLVEIVRSLIDAGARSDITNRKGQSALMQAARRADPSLLTFLLDRQVAIDDQDHDGDTALHWACMHNRAQCIALLLEHGANLDLVNVKKKLAAQCSTDPAVPALFAAWAARQAIAGVLGQSPVCVSSLVPLRRGP
jgi:ankyrin repeat protein